MKHETTTTDRKAWLTRRWGHTHYSVCSCGWQSRDYSNPREASRAGLTHFRLATKPGEPHGNH